MGIATGAGSNVGMHLGDATQLQLIVANATRQVNVVEEHVFQVIEVRQGNPEAARDAVKEGVEQIAGITDRAVEMIQLYTEPPNDPDEQNRQLRARARKLSRWRGSDAERANGVAKVDPPVQRTQEIATDRGLPTG